MSSSVTVSARVANSRNRLTPDENKFLEQVRKEQVLLQRPDTKLNEHSIKAITTTLVSIEDASIHFPILFDATFRNKTSKKVIGVVNSHSFKTLHALYTKSSVGAGIKAVIESKVDHEAIKSFLVVLYIYSYRKYVFCRSHAAITKVLKLGQLSKESATKELEFIHDAESSQEDEALRAFGINP
jgi:hypothetical protein